MANIKFLEKVKYQQNRKNLNFLLTNSGIRKLSRLKGKNVIFPSVSLVYT